MNFQSQLQSPYSRDAWLALLRDLFGHSAALFSKPVPVIAPAPPAYRASPADRA